MLYDVTTPWYMLQQVGNAMPDIKTTLCHILYRYYKATCCVDTIQPHVVSILYSHMLCRYYIATYCVDTIQPRVVSILYKHMLCRYYIATCCVDTIQPHVVRKCMYNQQHYIHTTHTTIMCKIIQVQLYCTLFHITFIFQE